MDIMENRIKEVLLGISPYLQEDGGDVELVSYDIDAGILYVRFLGNCAECPISIMTLRAGIERVLLDAFPEFKRIEQVKN